MVFCPLLSKQIDDTDCYLTATVIEGITPKCDAIPEALEVKDHEKICMACENHPE